MATGCSVMDEDTARRRVVVEEAHAAGGGDPRGGVRVALVRGARAWAVGPRGGGHAAAGKRSGARGGRARGSDGAARREASSAGASRGSGRARTQDVVRTKADIRTERWSGRVALEWG